MRTLVVGCSGGIGTAIVRHMKQKGHELAGIDQNSSIEPDLLSWFYEADLSQTDQVLSTCDRVKQDIPSLWAIVYCAGIYPIVDLKNYTIGLWDEVQSVNTKAAFIICLNLESIVEDGGRIVTIVSGAAHLGSRDVGYSASKAALLGLSKSLALNLAYRGIRVNAICPGPIQTAMSKRMPEERVKDYKSRILLNRFGRPEEIAVAVDFLLAPENSFMTGATVDLNGGLYLR
jgi:3-oxoacyl-[acyl-carrier protein] reductase